MATKGKINVVFVMRYIGALRANRIVANPNRYSTINYKDIVTYAARAAHVPESSIEVAMDALYDALSYFVLNGHNVKIDGLGTFFFGINAYAEEQIENAGADAIHRLKIGYLPEKDLREAMNNVAVTTTYTNPGNLAVDSSVPTKISSISYALTQSGTAKAVSLGDRIPVPEGGVYLVIKGARLGKINRVADIQAFRYYSPDDEVYGNDVADGPSPSIVARTENQVVVYVPRYVSEGLEIQDSFINSLRIVYEDETRQTYFYSSPYASAPQFGDTIQFGGKKGSLFILEDYKQKLSIAAAGSSEYMITFLGANMNLADNHLVFTNCTAVATALTEKKATYLLSNVTGVITVTINVADNKNQYGSPITITTSASSTEPVVTSLSANGISVANGGSSTVQAGQSYNFVFAGANLAGLSQSNLVVPQGATISNFAATASQVSFTLTIGSVGGTIGLRLNGATAFSVSVTIPSDIAATITNIEGVSNNGTKSVEISDDNPHATLAINGSGLDTLTAANIVFSGATVTLNEGSESHRLATLQFSSSPSDGPLRVQIDGTTVFTLNITWDAMM